jgi:hypothetical protein
MQTMPGRGAAGRRVGSRGRRVMSGRFRIAVEARARSRLGVASLLGIAAGALVVAPGTLAGAADAAHPSARAARTLNVKDEGHLHLAGKPAGSLIVEEGTVSGTLPGTVKVCFDVGATVTAQFTIYARGGGTVSGRGSGALHSTSLYSTFGGKLFVTSGTGRFKHARGTGGMYGAINRKTDALTVQTIGNLTY